MSTALKLQAKFKPLMDLPKSLCKVQPSLLSLKPSLFSTAGNGGSLKLPELDSWCCAKTNDCHDKHPDAFYMNEASLQSHGS